MPLFVFVHSPFPSFPPSLPPFLLSLTPSQGSYQALPPLSVLSSPSSLAPYSLIIVTQMDEASLRPLAAAAAAAGKPLLIARSYGLLGYLRLGGREGGREGG